MAKSRSIGGIYAELSLRDGKFKAGMKSAKAAIGDFAASAAKYAAAGGAVMGAALTAGTLKTMAMGGALDDLSATTGLAISDAMRLRKAFELGGLAADDAGKSIGKMQKSIFDAASGGEDPFKTLGLSAQQLLAMDPAEQFNQLGSAIMRIQNPAERTAKAMQIFGKAGAGVTNVFGQFEDAERFLGKMPQIFEQYGGAMARADDLVNELPNKSQQFFAGFTAGIIDTVLPGLEAVNGFDFTPLGQSLGNALTNAIKEAAIIMNTAFDVFTGQDSKGEGGGNKYKEAQLALDLEAQHDRALKEIERRSKIKNPITGLAAAEAMEKAKDPEMVRPATITANDYQRRGLSLDGRNPVIDKQTNLLTEVRDLLKRMADSSGPVLMGNL